MIKKITAIAFAIISGALSAADGNYNTLFIGATPGEHSESEYRKTNVNTNPNVHFLDFLPREGGASAGPVHKVDFKNPQQWNAFVDAHKGFYDDVYFDFLVAHHFVIDPNVPTGIHNNFSELLKAGAKVFVPASGSINIRTGKAHEGNPERFQRIEDHFVAAGLKLITRHPKEEINQHPIISGHPFFTNCVFTDFNMECVLIEFSK